MKLSVVLFTSKTLSDGTHPIMLRLFYKKKLFYKSLGISCKENEWNVDGCRKSFSSYATYNKIIRNEKSKAQERIDLFLANKDKKPFSIEDIFVPESGRKTIIEVIEEHKSQYFKFNTIQKYRNLVGRLKEYGYSNVFADQVDDVFLKTFYNRVKEGKKDITIYTYMAALDASLETAVRKKYITENPFIHTDFKYNRKTKKRALSRYDIDKLIVYYENNFLFLPYYEKEQLFPFSKKNSKYYALNIFLSSYYLQGLSLVDLAKLRVKDVVFKDKIIGENSQDFKRHHEKVQNYDFIMDGIKEQIENNTDEEERNRIMANYEGLLQHLNKNGQNTIVPSTKKQTIMTIETSRSKTNKPVSIAMEYKGMIQTLLNPNLKDKKPDDYLFSIYDSKCVNENYKARRLTTITNTCNSNLNKLREELNLTIDNLTLYCARHTYASVLYHNNVNSNLIAQNLGRDAKDIDVYLKQFDDDRIIEANKVLN